MEMESGAIFLAFSIYTFRLPKSSKMAAIAFAVSLAFGKEPAYLHFENSKMRPHLLNCLHSGVLTEFPCNPEQRKSLYVQAHTVPLYCTCRMPESDLMFQCTKCQENKTTHRQDNSLTRFLRQFTDRL